MYVLVWALVVILVKVKFVLDGGCAPYSLAITFLPIYPSQLILDMCDLLRYEMKFRRKFSLLWDLDVSKSLNHNSNEFRRIRSKL